MLKTFPIFNECKRFKLFRKIYEIILTPTVNFSSDFQLIPELYFYLSDF